MSKHRWINKPEGSNWGEYGPDDQRGRMNLLTAERRVRAAKEIRTGEVFCLSLPLDLPGGQVLNSRRKAPALHPVIRDGEVHFNLSLSKANPLHTDVSADDAVMLYNQYSTQWDALAHKGAHFDADGDGQEERVFYNGFSIVDAMNRGRQGALGAVNLSIDHMAETGVQGRGVMVDLRRHLGDERVEVGFDMLMHIMEEDGVVVEEGDILCLHTGLGQLIMDANGNPGQELRTACAVLDGKDDKLLQWITSSGVSAIAADNLAVERSSTLASAPLGAGCNHRGPGLLLHNHCIFKLGIHLGELWYLTALADWLHQNQRSRFFLTAPPLRLPGACGSPVTPVATV